ncbi:MAG TPA: helix-turn-helix transcriptional regulator [Dongiaceae bacterium]|nr:helix-turn-helix transcriptional regulator [Dongiaceae bacterium]
MTNIASGLAVAEIGALVGDVARANMLHALMAGRALTAGELAWIGGVGASTASEHLAKLAASGLVAVEKQGRHRYFRLSSPAVARMLEGISAVVATEGPQRYRPASRIDEALRRARLCYDHLAGRLGVALCEALTKRECVLLSEDGGVVTEAGQRFFIDLRIDLGQLQRRRRLFCRPCLDWSERRHHLAGSLGAALAARCFELGWIEPIRDSRAVAVTRQGREGLASRFGIRNEELRIAG